MSHWYNDNTIFIENDIKRILNQVIQPLNLPTTSQMYIVVETIWANIRNIQKDTKHAGNKV